MDSALPSADVRGWELHMDGLVLPDPLDGLERWGLPALGKRLRR
jgi:hypothetical protein